MREGGKHNFDNTNTEAPLYYYYFVLCVDGNKTKQEKMSKCPKRFCLFSRLLLLLLNTKTKKTYHTKVQQQQKEMHIRRFVDDDEADGFSHFGADNVNVLLTKIRKTKSVDTY